MENQKNEWKGVLNREKLFVGSKSEGLYPVLSGSDGIKYRVHVKGDGPKYKSLEPFEGKQVCMLATQDNLRGHKRLVVEFVSTETLVILMNLFILETSSFSLIRGKLYINFLLALFMLELSI